MLELNIAVANAFLIHFNMVLMINNIVAILVQINQQLVGIPVG